MTGLSLLDCRSVWTRTTRSRWISSKKRWLEYGYTDPNTGLGKTFAVERNNAGDWAVVYMIGEHDSAYYQQGDIDLFEGEPIIWWGSMALREMTRRLPPEFKRDNVVIYIYDQAVFGGEELHFSGQGGSGAPWEGEGAGYVLQGAHFLAGDGFYTLATRLEDQVEHFEWPESAGVRDWSPEGMPERPPHPG